MPVTIRPEVAQAVRRAAALIYIQSPQAMTYDWLALQLDSDAVDSDLIARWAEEDGWDRRRAEAEASRAPRPAAHSEASKAAKRAEACLRAVETLHNSACAARKQLRPKSWEQAAMVQLRCAEALRQWSIQDDAQEASGKNAPDGGPPPIPADSVLTEEQWQDLAHVALSKRNRREGADAT